MKIPFISNYREQVTKLQAEVTKLTEAIGSSVGESIDTDDYKYRSLTEGTADLPKITQSRMIEICLYLYTFNPLAHRIIEMTKDYIIGEGISFEAEDPKVQAVLDTFWNDPVNNWGERQHQFFAELGIYGELALPLAVNNINGKVQLGYLNPANIADVIANADNCLILEKIKLKTKGGKKAKVLDIIKVDTTPKSPTKGYRTGDCMFFKVNSVSDSTRGISDLFPIADWLDNYDQFLFRQVERAALINNFVWDVLCTGMQADEIKKYKAENSSPPKPGSVRYHNEKVIWSAIAPTLNALDTDIIAKLIKNNILAAAGFPEHFFASTDNVSGMVAEMNEPTLKKISSRQLYVKHIITNMFNFVIDQAIIYRKLRPDVNRAFAVIMPDISQKDNNRNARALAHLGTFIKQVSEFIKILTENKDVIGEDNATVMTAMYNKIIENASKAMNLIMERLGVNTKHQEGDPHSGKITLRPTGT